MFVTFNASMYTVAAIAIFRCKAILNPMTFKPRKKSIYVTIAGIWIWAIVSDIPLSFVLQVNEQTRQCEEVWPSQMLKKAYTIASIVAQYPFPLTIIAIGYTKIVLYLKRHKIPQCGLEKENRLQMTRKRKQDKEVLKISLIIVVFYIVLTLPIHLAWFSWDVLENSYLKNLFFGFADSLLLLHSCCNPLVYGSISRQFRAQLMAKLPSILCRCHSSRNRRTESVASLDQHRQEPSINMVDLTSMNREKRSSAGEDNPVIIELNPAKHLEITKF